MADLKLTAVPRLPSLAWCARIDRGGHVELMHGPGVEVGPDFFVEGAWTGPFAQLGFLEDPFFMGTGARITASGITFSSTHHPLERLSVLREQDRVWVSNSLGYLVAAANGALDRSNLLYAHDLASIVNGIDCYVPTIRLADGRVVELHNYRLVEVSNDLTLTTRALREPRQFRDYADFKGQLEGCLAALAENARDKQRRSPFGDWLASVSSGYDSAALAALARNVGCRAGFSVTDARPRVFITNRSDSGTPIGNKLGLQMVEHKRFDYHALPGMPERELTAPIGTEDCFMYAPFEPQMRGSLVTMGWSGDYYWGRTRGMRAWNKTLIRHDVSGIGLSEFRLRVGFVHVPLFFFGMRDPDALHRITYSDEMLPYHMKTYDQFRQDDRPLPRRILHEAGVDDSLFGQEKQMAAPVIQVDGWEAVFSPRSLAHFRDFVAAAPPPAKDARYREKVRRLRRDQVLKFGADKMMGLSRRLGVPLKIGTHPDRLARRLLGHTPYLFHWGMDEITNRYRTALGT